MTRLYASLFLCCAIGLLGADEPPKPFQPTPGEIKVFELTNQERKNKELPPLKLNPALSKIARAHSENMAKQGKMDHVLDEKGPFDRIRAAGYKFMKAGENVAFGEEEAMVPMIMKAWMESKAHAANILLPEFTEIGVGLAKDKTGQIYYTQLFATPRK